MDERKEWNEPFDTLELKRHDDERGMLFEILRFADHNIPGNGQLYTFSVEPNARRGDHYHLKKQEWFTCVYGKVIVLLTAMDGEDKAIEISSEKPQIIYAAPGTSHALINKESKVALVVSYGSEQHNPNDEDTYRKITFKSFQTL